MRYVYEVLYQTDIFLVGIFALIFVTILNVSLRNEVLFRIDLLKYFYIKNILLAFSSTYIKFNLYTIFNIILLFIGPKYLQRKTFLFGDVSIYFNLLRSVMSI